SDEPASPAPAPVGHNVPPLNELRHRWREAHKATDHAAGIEVTDAFEPFTQRDDIFTRAFWDSSVRSANTDRFFHSYRMEATPRRGEGFNQKDFALRNAAWLISDIIADRSAAEGRREGFQAPIGYDRPVAPDRVPVTDPVA